MALLKYVMAERAILNAIEEGRYPPGTQTPSQTALAEEMGVALMTLRRAVGRLVARGVLERRHGVGTFVRPIRRGPNLALLCFKFGGMEPGTLGWMELQSLRSAEGLQGRQVRIMTFLDPFPPPSQVASELRHARVGAVGLLGFLNYHRDYIRDLSQQIPCVLINKDLPGVPLPCAKPNLTEGAQFMVDYLIGRKRRRIGVMVASHEHSQHQELLRAVEMVLRDRCLMVDKTLWFEGVGPRDRAAGDGWMHALADRERRPDGLIISNFESREPIHRLERRLAERGGRLGKDLDVVEVWSSIERPANDVPWPLLWLDYASVVRNVQRMLLDIVEGRLEGAPARASSVQLLLPDHEPAGVVPRDLAETGAAVPEGDRGLSLPWNCS